MSSQNYFDLLGDDENEEPTAVIARATLPYPTEKPVVKKPPTTVSVASPGRLSTKTSPPSEAVIKESKPFEGGRGGRGGGRGVRAGGRGSYGDRERESGYQHDNRDGLSRERVGYSNDRNFSLSRENHNDGSQGNRSGYGGNGGGVVDSGVASYGVGYGGERAHRGDGENWSHEGSRGRGGRGVGRGRDRGLGSDGDDRHRRREFDRRSGSGFGNEIKRDGSGRGNWGSEGDQTTQQEAQEVSVKEDLEKPPIRGEERVEADVSVEDDAVAEDGTPKKDADDADNELTLDEYEKILESKRKALLSTKAEERKVQADKAFASMQLVDKKHDEDVFIKVGSEKEKKKKEKEALEKEEKAKKTQSINEFLKPADGEKYYGSGGNRGRGRGRGREGRGGDTRGGDGERVTGSGARGNVPGGLHNARRASAPRIEDPGQFPNLGAK